MTDLIAFVRARLDETHEYWASRASRNLDSGTRVEADWHLRDIAAKRAVCDGYDYAAHQVADATFTGVEDAAKILVKKQQLATLTQVLKIFAAMNETHGDYNPEWRPA